MIGGFATSNYYTLFNIFYCDNMINVGMYYNVKSGSEKEFEGIFGNVISSLKTSGSGILNAKLYKEVGSNEYMIFTEWESMEVFTKFIQSRGFKDTTTYGKSILEGPPKHRVFNNVE
jgi:heme-degrading monooxygenase HmoA